MCPMWIEDNQIFIQQLKKQLVNSNNPLINLFQPLIAISSFISAKKKSIKSVIQSEDINSMIYNRLNELASKGLRLRVARANLMPIQLSEPFSKIRHCGVARVRIQGKVQSAYRKEPSQKGTTIFQTLISSQLPNSSIIVLLHNQQRECLNQVKSLQHIIESNTLVFMTFFEDSCPISHQL